jgi:poly(3-hydroxybutyrate) depolymerase
MRWRRTLPRLVRRTLPWLALAAAAACAEPLPPGKSRLVLEAAGHAIEVHAYKPEGRAAGALLVSLHGLGRNAAGYRDYAVPLADGLGLLVIAPLFDRERFPTWRYQHGGIARDARGAGELPVEPAAQWTGRLLLSLIDAVRRAEGRPELPYVLLGHSAGGQFLSRFAAFVPHEARRILIANPSTYLWPSHGERFPFGFGALPAALADDPALRRYLAQPVTLLLGTADVERDADLSTGDAAERQGANRYQRGRNAYLAAERAARDHGWPLAWRRVDVPGVGHSARRLYASPALEAALREALAAPATSR